MHFHRASEQSRSQRSGVRRAFTLVELLVVIAVIVLLVSFVAVASVRAVHSARVNATRATIKKVDEMLSRRTAAFNRAMQERKLRDGGTIESELLKKYEWVPDSPMKNKRMFQKFFGMTFAEVSNNTLGLALPWTAADLSATERDDAGYISSAHLPETESSEMLYWMLVNGPTFGADVIEADSFASSEVADTDGDGLMEFIDAWGNPLRFYRWPTRLLRPGPPGAPASQGTPYHALGPAAGGQLTPDAPATFLIASLPTYNTIPDESLAVPDPSLRPTTQLGHDGDDELGEVFLTYFRDYQVAPGGTAVEAARQFEIDYHTLNTWHAPLIVSAGVDGQMGLYEPHDTANFGHLAQPMPNGDATAYSEALQDNITNLNSQASGSGGR